MILAPSMRRHRSHRSALAAACLALAALAACSKADPTTPPLPPEPSAAPEGTDTDPWAEKHKLAMASSAAAASPARSTAPASAASASPPAPASPSAPSAGAPPAPPPPPPKAPTCGDKPLPPCPLYAWMKANTASAMGSEDFDALATALDKVATFAPHDYPNWASIATDGAAAARGQNLDSVKASCRACHNQYKERYKRELRDRPL